MTEHFNTGEAFSVIIDYLRKYFEYEHSSSKNEWIFYHSIRTNMILSGSSKIRASRPPLPNGMAAPQIVLSSAPVSLADVQLVSKVFWIDTCTGSSFDKCLFFYIELSVHWSSCKNNEYTCTIFFHWKSVSAK